MKRTEWQPKKRIEADFLRAVNKLFTVFFDKMSGTNLSADVIMGAFRAYCQNGNFKAYVNSAASHMATALRVESAATWRQAANKATRGRMIYQALQKEMQGPVGYEVREIVHRNAALISSIPHDIAPIINRFIMEQSVKGKRAAEIAETVEAMTFRPDVDVIRRKIVNLTEGRIAVIARTETSKATTALTRARSEDLGLDWYIWRTSEDVRVRESHRHMHDVLISWKEAPNPEKLINVKSNLGNYHAGDAPNDRCFPEPVINIDRVSWPHKVYTGGRIVRMTRAQFASRFLPGEVRRAA